MFHRFKIWLTLVCYGAIALGGQGWHLLQHDHGPDDHEIVESHGSHGSAGHFSLDHSPDDCDHDSEHCAVCQHHSLGQLFIATPPAQVVLGVCELLDSAAPDVVVCPALFSSAQPRAPPIA